MGVAVLILGAIILLGVALLLNGELQVIQTILMLLMEAGGLLVL